MAEPVRISVEEARKMAGNTAILVCAYDDDQKFQEARLQGSVSLLEFESYLTFISKKQEIIFYCA